MSEIEILPPVTTTSEYPRLEVLADEIRRDIKDERARTLNIGRNLIECKALLPHGAWRQWLRDEFDMSVRSAQRYMNLARATDRLCGAYDLNAPSVAYLPMETVITLANAPDNLRDQVVKGIKTGYRPTDTEIYDALFKRHVPRPSECRFDKDELEAALDTCGTSHCPADDREAARSAIALIADLEQFKTWYRKAGIAFDLELFGAE